MSFKLELPPVPDPRDPARLRWWLDELKERLLHMVYQQADAAIDHGSLGGLTDDDHTQYALKSTLTTRGDLYAASAASTPARLALALAGTTLRSNGTDPFWDPAAIPVGAMSASDQAPVDGQSVVFRSATGWEFEPAGYPQHLGYAAI